MNADYLEFVKRKTKLDEPSGFDIEHDAIGFGGVPLKEFQRHIVKWALRRGRAAIFANTGLGKTAMQTTWAGHVAEHTGQPVLMVAFPPALMGITVLLCLEAVYFLCQGKGYYKRELMAEVRDA